MVMANQLEIMAVNKQDKKAVVEDVKIPNGSNIRKKEQEKHQEYQGLKEELERIRGAKASVVTMLKGSVWAVAPKLGESVQQNPGITSEISVQKSTILGTTKILCRTHRYPGFW